MSTTILRDIVQQQAEDVGLWFEAQTCPEAYIQQELRKLHAAVELMLDQQEKHCESCGAGMILRCADCGRRVR